MQARDAGWKWLSERRDAKKDAARMRCEQEARVRDERLK